MTDHCIINDMKQLIHMYWATKSAERVADRLDTLDAPASEVSKQFTRSYSWVKDVPMYKAFADAASAGYLTQQSPDTFRVTYEGRGLTDTIPFLPFIPIGLWERVLRECDKVTRVMIDIAGGTIGILFGYLIKSAYDRIF